MNWARAIILKSPSELEIMREAGRINALALQAVREAIRPGVTTAELDEIAYEVIRKHGGKPAFLGVPGAYPYPATLTVSVNDELVHGIPGKRRLQEGDIVSVDCGTIFEGFVGDSAFTVGVGEISPLAKRLIEVTYRALEIGIEQLRPGKRVGDVGAAIQSYVEGEGFFLTKEYTGHGVGRSMWEGPQVPNYGVPGRGIPLRAGMVIAIEPMVLVGTERTKVLADQWTVASADGSLTAHVEHTVAVTEDGPVVLTVP
ncbi:MAG: type I methionyl aminopeptidase [Anaerolineales bacterium]|nr:type I methionyl aminopeptidase [Anaerolineales bacterium]MCS7249068.1 type I methionyl aminopeptidase [Anaerolineales bacterium]MDW8162881.1 type I methionyl aminopeptidase [Anaerolineales bacterium]MDW8446832.1 type I methionyl aminopeptidase [Anaerolineales bacterium]